MFNKILISSFTALLFLSGCASKNAVEYDSRSYQEIKTIQYGTVTQSRAVTISDDGSGKFIGAIVGAVLGSTIGSNRGTTLAMLGGGLAGGYAGGEVGKANASELTVELDNGETVVVIAKVLNIASGERVKIIKDGNKAVAVDKIY